MKRIAVASGLVILAAGAILAGQDGGDGRGAVLQAVADSERAFARAALEKGIRDAFVEFFAEDSVGFYPTPTNARAFYAKRPPTPLSRRLEWEPRLGDVAQSGELGWLTGPFSFRDTEANAPAAHGCYFSIWRKQDDGSWKVLMDVGVSTPGPVTFAPGVAAVGEPDGHHASPGTAAPSKDVILRADRQLADAVARDGARAYEAVLTAVSRLHVPERQPMVGPGEILAWLRGPARTIVFTPETGEVARSGELAFTRGAYEESGGDATRPGEKGYYVRTWKRTADGRWTLGVEVRSPLPPP